MVDRPPPSRFSVVERGGRLVVIDRESGGTPPTAAQRMDAHDRNMGHEANRPVLRDAVTMGPEPGKASTAARPAQMDRPAASRAARKPVNAAERPNASPLAGRGERPWDSGPPPSPAPAALTASAPISGASARTASRPRPRGTRETIVTGKWWDAKGPRTVELGAKGQSTLRGGFIALFLAVVIAGFALLLIAPLLAIVAVFLLMRFGGAILGSIGAGLVDKAITERD